MWVVWKVVRKGEHLVESKVVRTVVSWVELMDALMAGCLVARLAVD